MEFGTSNKESHSLCSQHTRHAINWQINKQYSSITHTRYEKQHSGSNTLPLWDHYFIAILNTLYLITRHSKWTVMRLLQKWPFQRNHVVGINSSLLELCPLSKIFDFYVQGPFISLLQLYIRFFVWFQVSCISFFFIFLWKFITYILIFSF